MLLSEAIIQKISEMACCRGVRCTDDLREKTEGLIGSFWEPYEALRLHTNRDFGSDFLIAWAEFVDSKPDMSNITDVPEILLLSFQTCYGTGPFCDWLLDAWGVPASSIHITQDSNSKSKLKGKATYFLADSDRVKIGVTTDFRSRIGSLKVGNPRPLLLLGYLKGDREKEMHDKFCQYRVSGEWFDRHPAEQWLIQEAKNRVLLGAVDPEGWTWR